MIIADTNLVVYFTLRGERRATARAVRVRDKDWVAPPLWASEFRNVLATYVRAGRLTPAQARDTWETARALVRDEAVDPLRALDAAFDRGLSGYDAEFVALADALGVPLVTDDGRVLAACSGLAVSLDAFSGAEPTGDAPDDVGR